MKKSIKEKWVAALRSGEYRQCRDQLRRSRPGSESFCCLGVLCNLHAQAHPEIAAQQTDPEAYMGRSGNLPLDVVLWAGLAFEGGAVVTINSQYGHLAGHNDSGCTFAQIADAIEAQL